MSSSSLVDVGSSTQRLTFSETVLNITIDNEEFTNNDDERSKAVVGSSRTECSKLASPIYAMLLILVGVIFPMTEALYDKWLDTIYNMIFIVYTLSLSTIFIIYLQFQLIRDKRRHGNHVASKHGDHNSSGNSFCGTDGRRSSHRRQSVGFEAAVIRKTDNGGLPIDEADAAERRRSVDHGEGDESRLSPREVRLRSIESGRPTSMNPIDATYSYGRTGTQMKHPGSVGSKNGITATLQLHSKSLTLDSTSDVTGAWQSGEETIEEESEVWIDLTKLGTVFSHEGSSLYLRMGALAFALGYLIYIGLEIEARMNPSTRHCSGRFAWTYVLRLIFIVFQTFFILKNTAVWNLISSVHLIVKKISLQRSEVIVRFGLMHTIATNLSVWLQTLINEILNSFYRVGMADQQISAVDENSTTDVVCARFDEIQLKTSEYLFPFVLEYSLIAMGSLTIMYASIGQKLDRRSNILRGIQNLFKIRALEMSATDGLYASNDNHGRVNAGYVELNKSHRGLFAGVVMLTGCLIAVIMYLFEVSDWPKIIYLATDITVNVLLLVATIVAIAYLRPLSYIPRPTSVDDFLLLISMCGAVLFEIAIMMAAGNFISVHATSAQHSETLIQHNTSVTANSDNNSAYVEDIAGVEEELVMEQLRLSSSIIAAIQIILQVLMTLNSMRRYPSNLRQVVEMPGRGFVTFLVIGNVTVWIFRTALVQALTSTAETEYYGTITWLLLLNINLPLSLFFRFHSSVCLADIWYTAYTSPVHPPRRNVTGGVDGARHGGTSGSRLDEFSTNSGMSAVMRSYSMPQLNAIAVQRQQPHDIRVDGRGRRA